MYSQEERSFVDASVYSGLWCVEKGQSLYTEQKRVIVVSSFNLLIVQSKAQTKRE